MWPGGVTAASVTFRITFQTQKYLFEIRLRVDPDQVWITRTCVVVLLLGVCVSIFMKMTFLKHVLGLYFSSHASTGNQKTEMC